MKNVFDYNKKVLKYLDRIHEYATKRLLQPVSADISLTDRCNHNCPGCIGNRTDKKELTVEQWENIFDDLRVSGLKSIKVSGGGEPMLHNKCVEIVETAKEIGLEVGLYTNGSLLSVSNVKRLAESCTWIRVSLDANNSKKLKETHGVDTYDRIVENIKLLALYKKSCTVGVAYLISNDNHWVVDAVKQASTWGVDYAQIRPFNNVMVKDPLLVVNKAKNYQKPGFKVLHSPNRFNLNAKTCTLRCYAKYFIPSIATDGTVYPCCHLRGMEQYKLGDLRKEPILDILANADKAYFDNKNCVVACRGCVLNNLIEGINEPIIHQSFL